MRYNSSMEAIIGDSVTLKPKNSLRQFADFFSVVRSNEFLPIVFDRIREIKDNGSIESDKKILALNPQAQSYVFPVRQYNKKELVYLLKDDYGVKVKKIDSKFGEGFYDEFVDERVAVNSDKSALGVENVISKRVGTEYLMPDEEIVGD